MLVVDVFGVCVPIVGCLVGSVVLASIPIIVLRLVCSVLCVSISCLILSYLLSSAAEWMSLACALMIAQPSMCIASQSGPCAYFVIRCSISFGTRIPHSVPMLV